MSCTPGSSSLARPPGARKLPRGGRQRDTASPPGHAGRFSWSAPQDQHIEHQARPGTARRRTARKISRIPAARSTTAPDRGLKIRRDLGQPGWARTDPRGRQCVPCANSRRARRAPIRRSPSPEPESAGTDMQASARAPCPWARRRRACRPPTLSGGSMTAPDARNPQVLDRPALHTVGYPGSAGRQRRTPRRSVVTTLTWTAAYEQARQGGDLTPLVQTVRRWWFEADALAQPRGSARAPRPRRALPAREGPPRAEERTSWGEIRAQYGV